MLVGLVKLSRSDPICEIGVIEVVASSPVSVVEVGVEIGGLVKLKSSTAGAVLEITITLLLGVVRLTSLDGAGDGVVVRVNSFDGTTVAAEVMISALEGSGVDETTSASVAEEVVKGASVVDGIVDDCTAGSVVLAGASVDVEVSSCLR